MGLAVDHRSRRRHQQQDCHRAARAEISASAIAHNVRVLKSVVDDSLFCAVVKANGYGHGAELAAKAAIVGGADSLAVAIIDEGIELRSSGITAPILVLWGEADQIAGPEYGRAFAAAIPGAQFRLLTATGHLPQIETPAELLRPVWDFADAHATGCPAH